MTTAEREARIRALLASAPPMTNEERRLQRISFAYGNAKIDEPSLTRAEVEEAYGRIWPRVTYVVLECEPIGEMDHEAQWNVAYAGPSVTSACRSATPRKGSFGDIHISVQVWCDGEMVRR